MSRPVEETAPSSGDTARLIVSCVVFIHLFAVIVASLHQARATPAMVRRLQNKLVGPYAQALNIGQYSYHLTYALDFDFDHNCDVLVNWPPRADDATDATEGTTRLALYDARDSFPRHRRRRYQMLSLAVDMAANSEAPSGTLLPLAVVRTILAENGVTSGEHRFRCRVTTAPRPPWSEALRQPPEMNVYRVNVVHAGGLAQFHEFTPEGQVAPIDRRRGGNRATEPRLGPPLRNTPAKQQDGDRK